MQFSIGNGQYSKKVPITYDRWKNSLTHMFCTPGEQTVRTYVVASWSSAALKYPAQYTVHHTPPPAKAQTQSLLSHTPRRCATSAVSYYFIYFFFLGDCVSRRGSNSGKLYIYTYIWMGGWTGFASGPMAGYLLLTDSSYAYDVSVFQWEPYRESGIYTTQLGSSDLSYAIDWDHLSR